MKAPSELDKRLVKAEQRVKNFEVILERKKETKERAVEALQIAEAKLRAQQNTVASFVANADNSCGERNPSLEAALDSQIEKLGLCFAAVQAANSWVKTAESDVQYAEKRLIEKIETELDVIPFRVLFSHNVNNKEYWQSGFWEDLRLLPLFPFLWVRKKIELDDFELMQLVVSLILLFCTVVFRVSLALAAAIYLFWNTGPTIRYVLGL